MSKKELEKKLIKIYIKDESDSDTEIKKKKKVKFLDDQYESDDDETQTLKKTQLFIISKIRCYPKLFERSILDYLFVNVKSYNFDSWQEVFKDKVILQKLLFNKKWIDFFSTIEDKREYIKMEKILTTYLKEKDKQIVPYPELVLNAFNIVNPENIKFVLIGQDPYPGGTIINDKLIPDATGFCFSAPLGIGRPKSLNNIYKFMLHNKHIKKIPEHGCLSNWVMQGGFLINASLTTFHKEMNAHNKAWNFFTRELIKYLNSHCKNIVFIVWGKPAHLLCREVDPSIHKIITSSHPSPFSYEKSFKGFSYIPSLDAKGNKLKKKPEVKTVTYPAFCEIDHFGETNKYLKSVGKTPIIWDLMH